MKLCVVELSTLEMFQAAQISAQYKADIKWLKTKTFLTLKRTEITIRVRVFWQISILQADQFDLSNIVLKYIWKG